MSRGSFSFPNPVPSSAIRAIHGASVTTRFDLPLSHNPWPETANTEALEEAWTQPLIHAVYSPLPGWDYSIPRPRGYWKHDLSHLGDMAAEFHEDIHNTLGFTPAKQLALTQLVMIHREINALFICEEDDWTDEVEQHWITLVDLSESLAEIAQAIVLVEELFATAGGFTALEGRVSRRWDREFHNSAIRLLEEIECLCVSNQEERLPGFADMYPPFQKVLRLAEKEWERNSFPRATLGALLLVNLEPVCGKNHGGYCADPHYIRHNCEAIVERLEAVRTSNDLDLLVKWLKSRLLSPAGQYSDLAIDWAVVTCAAIKRAVRRNGPANLARAKGSDEHAAAALVDYYLNWPGAEDEPCPRAYLFPVRTRGGWWIRSTFENYQQLRDELCADAVRQQVMGRGFVCPFRALAGWEDRCLCDASPTGRIIKRGFHRLYSWAKEARLGAGCWTPLPPPCSAES